MKLIISGLTPEQVAMANQLWNLENSDQLFNFLDNLKGEDRVHGWAMLHLITAIALDNVIDVNPQIPKLLADISQGWGREY